MTKGNDPHEHHFDYFSDSTVFFLLNPSSTGGSMSKYPFCSPPVKGVKERNSNYEFSSCDLFIKDFYFIKILFLVLKLLGVQTY